MYLGFFRRFDDGIFHMREPKKPNSRKMEGANAGLKTPLLVAVLVVLVFTVFYAAKAGSRITIENEVEVPPTTTVITTSSSTSSTSTTSSSTITSSTTSTTLTSSTTTTVCGGELQPQCENGCGEGFVMNSEGLCQPVECTQSVPSGNDGCGAFALKFCTPGYTDPTGKKFYNLQWDG